MLTMHCLHQPRASPTRRSFLSTLQSWWLTLFFFCVRATANIPSARIHKIGNDLFRDVEEPIFSPKDGSAAAAEGALPRQNFAQLSDTLPDYEKLVPPPTLRYDAQRMELRNQRMLGRPHGGTVVVHFLKRHEWFLETSLALLGRHNTWDSGLTPPYAPAPAGQEAPPPGDASADLAWNGRNRVQYVDAAANWGTPRQYGSPIVRSNGYIAEGREGPFQRAIKLPVDERQNKKSVWGRLRGKPKLRLADPDDEEDGSSSQSASEDLLSSSQLPSASPEADETTSDADASSETASSPTSKGAAASSSTENSASSPSSSSSDPQAAPPLVLQPHHRQR